MVFGQGICKVVINFGIRGRRSFLSWPGFHQLSWPATVPPFRARLLLPPALPIDSACQLGLGPHPPWPVFPVNVFHLPQQLPLRGSSAGVQSQGSAPLRLKALRGSASSSSWTTVNWWLFLVILSSIYTTPRIASSVGPSITKFQPVWNIKIHVGRSYDDDHHHLYNMQSSSYMHHAFIMMMICTGWVFFLHISVPKRIPAQQPITAFLSNRIYRIG